MPQLAIREPKDIWQNAIEEIRNLHAANIQRAREMTVDGILIGEKLSLIRASQPRGDWSDWVLFNLPFGIRQAQRYMSFYDRRDQLKNDMMSHPGEQPVLVTDTNGAEERAPQRLHESNFYTKSIRLTQTLMGDINHEIKDRPVEQWDRNNLITLAAALEPLAELYSKLKSLL